MIVSCPGPGVSRPDLLLDDAISLQLPSSVRAMIASGPLLGQQPPPSAAAAAVGAAPQGSSLPPQPAGDNFDDVDNSGALLGRRPQPTLEVIQYADGRCEVTLCIGVQQVVCDFNLNKGAANSSGLVELYEHQRTPCAEGARTLNSPAPASFFRSADEPPSKRQKKMPDDAPSCSSTTIRSLVRVSSNVQAKLRVRPVFGNARRAPEGESPNAPHGPVHRRATATTSQPCFPPLCDRQLLLRARQVSHLIHVLQMTRTQQQQPLAVRSNSNAVNWVHTSAADLLKRLKIALDANTALFRSLAARKRKAADRPAQLAEIANRTEALRVGRAQDLITLTKAYEGILGAI